MTDETRNAVLQLLGEAMSNVSEDCLYAGWSVGTEYLVPELCRRAVATGQTRHWGHGEVTPGRGLGLSALAEWVGSWANLDAAATGYVPFQPHPVPPRCLEELDWWQSRVPEGAG
ncbi:MAG: hypothetical protein C0501_16240 [Isosphaera sp.]|nr:hypothetical protein [Isosphaera sp.]